MVTTRMRLGKFEVAMVPWSRGSFNHVLLSITNDVGASPATLLRPPARKKKSPVEEYNFRISKPLPPPLLIKTQKHHNSLHKLLHYRKDPFEGASHS